MKLTKVLPLLLLSLGLYACGQNEEPKVEQSSSSVESVTSSSSSESTATSTSDESNSNKESDESSSSSTADESDKKTDAITLKFYVTGDENPVEEYTVEAQEGQSVLDAMKAITPALDFTFNEDAGLIDNMLGHENDYNEGNTWVYTLNDQVADLGVVSQKLKKGDVIKWYYGSIDDIPVIIIPAESTDDSDE